MEGVAAGTYLVVDEDLLDRWGVYVSPFGAIPKGDDGEIRLIHDLAFPIGKCVNQHTVRDSLPRIHYDYVSTLAGRIEDLHAKYPAARPLMLKGDVQGAFRHLRQRAPDVRWMGGRLRHRRAGVIDLSAPFGWTGSPAFYSVFGRAISTIVSRESPASMLPGHRDTTPFFAYEWVDDHVMLEPDLQDRCLVAEDTLRLAMLAVLGPTAINESKFTQWSTKVRALDLDWDTIARSVSMPPEKIAKALHRVEAVVSSCKISTTHPQRLLGSLRHVATCIRASRPFYQRLHNLCIAAPRQGFTTITPWVADDLRWFGNILHSGALHTVPTRLFGSPPPPDVHLYMDASGEGLCVLDPAARRYILVTFNADELLDEQFDINIREQFAIALACMMFGPSWHAASAPTWPHIRCWSDNKTTVARSNKLSARHPLAQELNRCIGLAEATWRLRVSTAHIPGAWNTVADAGSRHQHPTHRRTFANAVASWCQIPIPSNLRRVYKTFSSHYSPHHWPRAPGDFMTGHGNNGASGVDADPNRTNFPGTVPPTQPNSRYSPSPVGLAAPRPYPTRQRPYCPNVAISHGIIKSATATLSSSPTPIASLCSGCDGCQPLPGAAPQLRSPISVRSVPASTSSPPATALSGGLLSWATSSCYEDPNISAATGLRHGL